MKTLSEIYIDYQFPEGHGDKGTAHTYIDEYDKLLGDSRDNITILEIGVRYGHSIRMWNEYFTNSNIVGIEINIDSINVIKNDAPFNENTNTLHIIHGNATNENILEELKDYKFDVIIDDGSHFFNDQVKSFNLLKNKMNLGGTYIIEDVSDIKSTKQNFINLHPNSKIIDNRHIKNRYDDVLVVYKF
jgi:hypothetical protein